VTNIIKTSDRIKELTFTTGTGTVGLTGATDGFSSFSSEYNHGDIVFYAITDGEKYEVGSGVFTVINNDLDNTEQYALQRHSLKSSNSNDTKIDFLTGPKEVFVTYPATHSVYHAAGHSSDYPTPQDKGLAVWSSRNVLNYYSSLKWDDDFKCLSIQQSTDAKYGVDVGGDSSEFHSRIRASGYYVGDVGVYFRANNGNDSSYQGGTQFKHFLPNTVDTTTYASLVLNLDGDVKENIKFKTQSARYIFAGPQDDCSGGCPDDYPRFRLLHIDDIPDLSSLYTTPAALEAASGVLKQQAEDYTDSSISTVTTTFDTLSTSLNASIANLETASSNQTQSIEDDLDLFRDMIATKTKAIVLEESGPLMSGIASGIACGPNGCSITKSVTSTVPSIASNDIHYQGFYVSGVVAGGDYAITISPEKSLSDKIMLTYAFPSDTVEHYVSGVFYNPLGTSSASQAEMKYHIHAKAIWQDDT
jgi:hypothetical protein